jgi:hypothetical protein
MAASESKLVSIEAAIQALVDILCAAAPGDARAPAAIAWLKAEWQNLMNLYNLTNGAGILDAARARRAAAEAIAGRHKIALEWPAGRGRGAQPRPERAPALPLSAADVAAVRGAAVAPAAAAAVLASAVPLPVGSCAPNEYAAAQAAHQAAYEAASGAARRHMLGAGAGAHMHGPLDAAGGEALALLLAVHGQWPDAANQWGGAEPSREKRDLWAFLVGAGLLA